MSNKEAGRVAIVGGVRTPFVKSGTVFKKYSALDLGVHSVNGLLEKLQIAPDMIEEMFYGIVVVDPTIPQMAREINFSSELPVKVRSATVTDNCITGATAISAVYHSIVRGRIEVGIAGGVESMSNPAVLFNRKASRAFLDAGAEKSLGGRVKHLLKLRPWDFTPWNYGIAEPSTGLSMGQHCELMVKEWNVSQSQQDEVAYQSHINAHTATVDGRLKAEIHPLDEVEQDLLIRSDTTLDKLARLRPVFDRSTSGTITAGNASPLTDGAASVLLMSERRAEKEGREPLAFIKAFEFVGIDPKDGLLMGPGLAVPRLLQRTKLQLKDMDIIEMHEAFGGQVVCNLKAWEQGWKEEAIGAVDREKLNPLGGSIAIGHPFAATGIRIATTLANEMKRRDARYGLISICGAGATAAAIILERGKS